MKPERVIEIAAKLAEAHWFVGAKKEELEAAHKMLDAAREEMAKAYNAWNMLHAEILKEIQAAPTAAEAERAAKPQQEGG